MDIYINNEKIDFKLENEKMLFQVIDGINEWANSGGYIIQDIYFDDTVYSHSEKSCREKPIDAVGCINIKAKSSLEVHQDNIQLLHQYITLFSKALTAENHELIKELQTESDSVTRLLASFLGENRDDKDSISRSLYENIMFMEQENKALTEQLTYLDIIINERISELADPFGELKKTVTAMKNIIEEINDVSVLLQTGKDRDALNSIIKFSELSQKILRLYPLLKGAGMINIEEIVIGETNFSDFYIDFNKVLTELIEAFSAKDSVLIGDILEYEVAPRVSSLVETLDVIKKE